MAKSDSRRRGSRGERERFWVEHLKRLASEGGQAKAYAQRNGLSVPALYQARKRLVARGAWPGAGRPRFARVAIVPASRASGGCRLCLPSGARLEWDTPPEVSVLAALVERISSSR